MLRYNDDGKMLIRVNVVVISHEHIRHADKLSSEIRSAFMDWEMRQEPWYVECLFVRFEQDDHRMADTLFDQVHTGRFYVIPHVAHLYFYRPDILEPQKDGTIKIRGADLHPGDLIDFYMDYKRKHS